MRAIAVAAAAMRPHGWQPRRLDPLRSATAWPFMWLNRRADESFRKKKFGAADDVDGIGGIKLAAQWHVYDKWFCYGGSGKNQICCGIYGILKILSKPVF